jgi:hypothetical protein
MEIFFGGYPQNNPQPVWKQKTLFQQLIERMSKGLVERTALT